jgi:hypothetical protein
VCGGVWELKFGQRAKFPGGDSLTIYAKFEIVDKVVAADQGCFGFAKNGFMTDKDVWTYLYYPFNDSSDSNTVEYISWMNGFGTTYPSLVCFNFSCGTTQADHVLPIWIEDGVMRKNSINNNMTTCGIWEVLDGIVKTAGKSVYFRLFYPPSSIVGDTTFENIIWPNQYSLFRNILSGSWDMMGKLQSFYRDVVDLCYVRYGDTECNKWIFSVGNEVGTTWVSEPQTGHLEVTGIASDNDLMVAILKYNWGIFATLKSAHPQCRTSGIESWQWCLIDIVDYCNSNRGETDYLQYTDYLAHHTYPSQDQGQDYIMNQAVNASYGGIWVDWPAFKTTLAAYSAYRGRSSPGIIHGETGYGNPDDTNPTVSITWRHGVWKTLLLSAAYYNGDKQIMQWTDVGDPWGFIHMAENTKYDSTSYLLPVYYGQAAIKGWARLNPLDSFVVVNSDNSSITKTPCNSVNTGLTSYAMKLNNSDVRVICIWNRTNTATTSDIVMSLDSGYASSGSVKLEKFEQSEAYQNGNITVVGTAYSYSGSNVVVSGAALPAYSFVMYKVSGGTATPSVSGVKNVCVVC